MRERRAEGVVVPEDLTVNLRLTSKALFDIVNKHLAGPPSVNVVNSSFRAQRSHLPPSTREVMVADDPQVEVAPAGQSAGRMGQAPSVLLLDDLRAVNLLELITERRWHSIVLTHGIPQELHRAIRVADLGGCWLAPSVLAYSRVVADTQIDYFLCQASDWLTPMERTVLRHVVKGLSNSDVAAELHISPTTVRTHLRAIFRKTGCTNRHQLTAHVHGASSVQPGR